MSNAELINNMRACIRIGVLIDDCDITDDCHYSEDGECGDCMLRMVNNAADALEAAEKRIAELEKQHGNQLTRNIMLTARLPKEGEWIWDDTKCIYRCSICNSPKARENMDREAIKEQRFCYNCGARMRKGEQE